MLRRAVVTTRRAMTSSTSTCTKTPVEDAIRSKITKTLTPSRLEIYNDSHLHAHHTAMRSSSSSETHFRLVVTSDKFAGQRQPARHRMVYALLRDEMAREDGIHALQLRTMTPEEEAARKRE